MIGGPRPPVRPLRLPRPRLVAGSRSIDRRVVRRVALVVGLWLGYGAAIGSLHGTTTPAATAAPASGTARDGEAGRQLWRRLGCPTCHSLYGLGGHLGPDLTTAARPGREPYVAATVRAGRRGMPRFELSAGEMEQLLGFLRVVAASGNYPPQSFAAPVF